MLNNLMLSIFNSINDSIEKITIAIITILVVGVIIYFFLKSEKFRVFCGYALIVVLAIGGIFSGYHINKYYNTQGGIVGGLTQILNPNAVQVKDDNEEITFDFSSVMMTQVDGDKYRAEFITSDFIELSTDEYYVVYVNDTPCELIEYGENYDSEEISSDYVICEYYYAFYNEYQEFKLKDTLTFRFAFYKNSTRLIVETTGGDDAVSMWNSYFQKNDFIITIKAEPTILIASFAKVDIKIEDEIVETLTIKKGSVYVLADTYNLEGYRFMGWSLDGENITTETKLTIVENTTVYAIFEKLTYVKFNYLNDDTVDQNSNIYEIKSYINGEALSVDLPDNPSRYHYAFLGWSLDGETVINLSEVINDGTITNIYAVWQAKNIELNVNLDGGSMTLNGATYSNNFSIYVSADEKIMLSKPAKDGYNFANYVISNPMNDYYFTTGDETISLTIFEIYFKLYGITLNYPNYDEVLEDFEITSLNIKATYTPTADNIDYWTDDDLKEYIEFNLGMASSEDYVYESTDNETWIKKLYYNFTYSEPTEEMSIYEIEKTITDILNAQYGSETTFNETITTREYLELLHNIIKNYVV